MIHLLLAEATMALHFAFVLFVALGGFLLFWRPRIAWIHLPCALYGAAIEFFGWVCPLTPLENRFRRLAGQAGYEGGFVEHYLGGVLYPSAWGEIHLWLGVAVLVGNTLIYLWVWARRRWQGPSGRV